MHGGIYLGMSQKLLHLLHGHTLVDGEGGEGTAEFVGMDAGDFQSAAQLAQANLHAADLQPGMGLLEGDEQRWVFIVALIQVAAQVDLGAGVEIGLALLAALAEHDALAIVEVDVGSVQMHQLAHTHAGGGQQIDDGQVAQGLAAVAHHLQRFIGSGAWGS